MRKNKSVISALSFTFVCLVVASAAAAPRPIREYVVDGRPMTLGAGEQVIDLAKIYPDGYHPDKPGTRWAVVEATVDAEKAGHHLLYVQNDWFGELSVNGRLASSKEGPVDAWRPVGVELKKGANKLRFRSRAGIHSWVCGLATDDGNASVAWADFSRPVRPLRRELHSSGFGPTVSAMADGEMEDLKAMGFKAARTHDWALVNKFQRVCDYFHIFPLMHLDAKDPKNYYFGPTDYLLKRTREEAGLDVFYRLGTSIEHTGKTTHFNTLIPDDFDKVAEIFAGTVRHYNRGWADGYEWGIKYWEIWNEPEGIHNMWCPKEDLANLPPAELEAKRDACRAKFVTFFVKVLKRLKGEFGDTIRVGGPALCNYNRLWMTNILESCRQAGVAPDFLSWHGYENDPMKLANDAERVRALCDSYGFTKTELIVNEWHYFGRNYNWPELQLCADPLVKARIWEGPDSHNGIRSACFTLATLANLQRSKLDQAYWYGCGFSTWGYKDALQRKYTVFYAMKLFGDILRDYTTLCASANGGTVYTMAVTRPDGRKGLLVVDYGGTDLSLALPVSGVKPGAKVTATVLDDQHNLAPIAVDFSDGELVIQKNDFHSALFFVEFDAQTPCAGLPTGDLLQTKAIQEAIDRVAAKGGGEVVIPEGRYRTGGLVLKSGVTLHLAEGAELEADRDPDDYPGSNRWYRALIRADGAHDVGVVGERHSTIDGMNCYDARGEEGFRGPHALMFLNCTNVTLGGYAVRDSANWAHAIFHSRNVRVRNVRVFGGHDAFDFHDSENVDVADSEFHTGDDCLAGFANRHCVFRDCVLDTSCNAVRIGGNDILFERCRLTSPSAYGHRWGLSDEEKRLSVNAGERIRHGALAGVIYYCDRRWTIDRPQRDIVFRDCTFDRPGCAFLLDYNGRNMWCCRHPLESIVFEGCAFNGVEKPISIYGDEAKPLAFTLRRCVVRAAEGCGDREVLTAYNFKRLTIEETIFEGFDSPRLVTRSKGEVCVRGGTTLRREERVDPLDRTLSFEECLAAVSKLPQDAAGWKRWADAVPTPPESRWSEEKGLYVSAADSRVEDVWASALAVFRGETPHAKRISQRLTSGYL